MGNAVTTIRANCPTCGDVQLTADDLTVRVCADDERGSYCFRCPDCRQAVAKEASRRTRSSRDLGTIWLTLIGSPVSGSGMRQTPATSC